MALGTIINKLHSFDKSATLLFDQECILPGLALLYTEIDIAASLERLAHEGTKQAFTRWCESYLLKGSPLGCTSVDLYSARCGILHAHTAESDLSRIGKARMIYYAWGTATADRLDAIARLASKSDAVNIHVNDLRDAVRSGIDKWAADVQKNPTRTVTVVKRSEKWFTNLSKDLVEEALRGIPEE
jgi:hypothetical protein